MVIKSSLGTWTERKLRAELEVLVEEQKKTRSLETMMVIATRIYFIKQELFGLPANAASGINFQRAEQGSRENSDRFITLGADGRR